MLLKVNFIVVKEINGFHDIKVNNNTNKLIRIKKHHNDIKKFLFHFTFYVEIWFKNIIAEYYLGVIILCKLLVVVD